VDGVTPRAEHQDHVVALGAANVPGIRGLGDLLPSALGRDRGVPADFAGAGLDKCEDFTGLILGDAVTLCFDATTACRDQDCTTWQPWATTTALHELAHAWMDEHLTPEVIEQFLAATGMPTWSSPKHTWGQRGVELAAETIAWATADHHIRVNPKLGPHTCDELAQDYQILTGRPPEPAPPGCQPTPTG
jgi:hypothetical protein